MTSDHDEQRLRYPRPQARTRLNIGEIFAELAAGFAEAKKENPHASADLQRNLALIIGSLMTRRKLRKLGFTKKEAFFAAAVLGSLASTATAISDIRLELRKQTALLDESSARYRTRES